MKKFVIAAAFVAGMAAPAVAQTGAEGLIVTTTATTTAGTVAIGGLTIGAQAVSLIGLGLATTAAVVEQTSGT